MSVLRLLQLQTCALFLLFPWICAGFEEYLRGTALLSEREVGSARVTYAYSDFGELDDLRVRAGGELFRVCYTRDDLGRITEARETNQGTTTTWTYSYDLLGQLTEVRLNGTLHATYTYDANSNRVGIVSPDQTIAAASIAHNGDDQLLQYGDRSYTYNAAGQLAQKTQGGQLTRYSYGVLGELQRVELPDGRAITYQYDALKRRIGRLVNGAWTHRFLWGGGPGPVAELDANGNTLTTFVYGTGIGSPDYMVRGSETYALIRDHLGSVRFVLNTADNAIAQELRYDPFGKVILDTNPGFQPFGYAGGLYDADTDLTRFGARDYDAHTGRWTARDPIAFGGGQTNLYVYVGNDPINFVDPNGAARVHTALLAALSAAWPAFEFSATMYDVFDFARTMTDSCSSDLDRILSGGGLLAGVVLPGAGYGVGTKGALGPIAGGGAKLDHLLPGEIRRIQNAANRTGQEITVVGSRAGGTAKPTSDWDYLMSGKSSQRHSASSSVPRGTHGGDFNSFRETGIDILRGPLDENLPHIIFLPE